MLDGWARLRIDPLLRPAARAAAAAGMSANAITLAAFALGVAAAAAIAAGFFAAGLVLMLASRACDALDGAVARISGRTDLGGYLDIALDFAVYGAIPFGFIVADPARNAVAGAALLLSFYVNGASFLAFAAVAARRGLESAARGEKSIFFTTGLAEATETILFFAVCCVFPNWFAALAWLFAALTLYTAVSRVALAWRAFGPDHDRR